MGAFTRTITLCLSLVFFWTIPAQADSKISIVVLLDNSAALRNDLEAEEFKKFLFFHLTELRKRHATKRARINIISINNPRNLWTGTATDLFRNGKEVLKHIPIVKNGCSDLSGAFLQIGLNLQRRPVDRIRVYVFSSLIHTGAPCDGKKIELPQTAPDDLDLSFLADRATSIRFYWVSHLQVKPWLAHMRGSGIGDVVIHDEIETRTILRQGLDQ